MQVGDLVKTWNAPLEGREFEIPPWYLCAIREITGGNVIVLTPAGQTLTFRVMDVEIVDS